jgi:hypothetical protein
MGMLAKCLTYQFASSAIKTKCLSDHGRDSANSAQIIPCPKDKKVTHDRLPHFIVFLAPAAREGAVGTGAGEDRDNHGGADRKADDQQRFGAEGRAPSRAILKPIAIVRAEGFGEVRRLVRRESGIEKEGRTGPREIDTGVIVVEEEAAAEGKRGAVLTAHYEAVKEVGIEGGSGRKGGERWEKEDGRH